MRVRGCTRALSLAKFSIYPYGTVAAAVQCTLAACQRSAVAAPPSHSELHSTWLEIAVDSGPLAGPNMLRRAVLLLGCATSATGHGAISWPPSRNAVDGRGPRALSPWKDGRTKNPPPFGGYNLCAVPGSKDPKTVLTTNGQACYYFSNGCSHGCPQCDTVTRGP